MNAPLTNSRTGSFLELAIVLVLVETWLWIDFGSAVFHVLAGAAIAAIVLKNVLRPDPGAWNTGRPLWSLRTTWTVVIVVTCLLVAGAMLGARLLYVEGETMRLGRLLQILDPGSFASKVLFVTLQQLVLCLLFFPLLYRIFGSRRAALFLTAGIFGALHLPSLMLTGLAAAASAVWLLLFQRSQRLVPLIVSHVVLVTAVAAGFPERLTYNLAVGRKALPIAEKYERLASGQSARRYGEWKSDAFYKRKDNTGRGFVVALYRDAVQRSLTEPEIETLLLKLHERNRAEIVARLMNSDEYFLFRCRVEAVCK